MMNWQAPTIAAVAVLAFLGWAHAQSPAGNPLSNGVVTIAGGSGTAADGTAFKQSIYNTINVVGQARK